ncbi:MAG TPA: anti-sigma factor antagonist [Syntrophaceae bacterium]|nr:anti-sigma factor antagonist [Syntrophaceae bacterium]
MLTITEDTKGTVSFSGELNIHNLEKLRDKLNRYLREGRDLFFDFKRVTIIDTAAIQLLISFKKSCDRVNKRLTIELSPTIQKTLETMGIRGVFR